MAFTNSSLLILDETNTTASFQTNVSTPISIQLDPQYNGQNMKYVVSRSGYECILGDFVGGGSIDIVTTPYFRTKADGSDLVTNTSNSFISITFDLTDGSERCLINIGNNSVTAQDVINAIELALETEDGCKFLEASLCSECTVSILAGQTYLLLGTQYRVIRQNPADANASIQAFVISADGVPLDASNGSVQFLVASTAVNVVQVNGTDVLNIDEFKADLTSLETKAQADARQTALIAEHDQTQTDIAGLTFPDVSGLATQASVDAIDTNIDAVLADTNELQTNQGNWVTATGFATPSDVTNSETAIVAEIDANEVKIDAIQTAVGNVASDVWSDTATYTGNEKGKVLKDAKDKASLSASLSA